MPRATTLAGKRDLAAFLAAHPRAVVLGGRLGTPRADVLQAALGEALGRGIALGLFDVRADPTLAGELGLASDPQLLFHRRGRLVMRELVPRCDPYQLRRLVREAARAWESYLGKELSWPVCAPNDY